MLSKREPKIMRAKSNCTCGACMQPLPQHAPSAAACSPANGLDMHEVAVAATVAGVLLILPAGGLPEVSHRRELCHDRSASVVATLQRLHTDQVWQEGTTSALLSAPGKMYAIVRHTRAKEGACIINATPATKYKIDSVNRRCKAPLGSNNMA